MPDHRSTQGSTSPLTAAEGQWKGQRDPAPSVAFQSVSGHSSANLPKSPFNPFTLLASTMTSGNEVYSPLTHAVKHILAGFKPAASHFIKWHSSSVTRNSKCISLFTFSRILWHHVFQALLFLAWSSMWNRYSIRIAASLKLTGSYSKQWLKKCSVCSVTRDLIFSRFYFLFL